MGYTSKALVMLKNKPLIAYQVEWLRTQGVSEIVVSGKASDKALENYCKENSLIYAAEKEKLGTAGGLKNALRYTQAKRFHVMNCDDLAPELKLNELDESKYVLCVVNPQLPFGLVTEKDGKVEFIEKPKLENLWVNLGHYQFDRDIVDFLPDKGDLEKHVLPRLGEQGLLTLYYYNGLWFTFNTLKDVERFEKESRGLEL